MPSCGFALELHSQAEAAAGSVRGWEFGWPGQQALGAVASLQGDSRPCCCFLEEEAWYDHAWLCMAVHGHGAEIGAQASSLSPPLATWLVGPHAEVKGWFFKMCPRCAPHAVPVMPEEGAKGHARPQPGLCAHAAHSRPTWLTRASAHDCLFQGWENPTQGGALQD